MAEYLSPGVFIEEVAAQAQVVSEVGTSTGAFVGVAERGDINAPQLVTSFSDYQRYYGGFNTDGYLPYALWNFFIQGGSRAYVTRVTASGGSAGVAAVGSNWPTVSGTGFATLSGVAATSGVWGNNLTFSVLAPSDGSSSILASGIGGTKFDIEIKEVNTVVDRLKNITVSGASTFFAEADARKYIKFNLVNYGVPSGVAVALAGGNDGLTNLHATDFIGTSANRKGMYGFDEIDDVNILAVPDAVNSTLTFSGSWAAGTAASIHAAVATYCEGRQDVFGVLDVPKGYRPTDTTNGGALQYKQGASPFSHSAFSSSYVALYFPHVYFLDPKTSDAKLLPPSTFVPGIISRTDQKRAVWKAPAGIVDGAVRNALGIEYQVSKGDQDVLNPAQVNCIRKFPVGGIVVWGTRTCAVDSNFLYIPVRRLFMTVEESIQEATQIFVFEPNNEDTRADVRRTCNAYLLNVWRQGGLVGKTANEAFFVKCDEENNPPSVTRAGKLIVDIGLAAVKPAEFVVFRFQHDTRALDAELAAAGL